jgi:hypothetical protein
MKATIVLGVQEVKYACMYLPLSEPSNETRILQQDIGKCKKFLESQNSLPIQTEAAHG